MWSSLKKDLKKLWVDNVQLDIHSEVYRMKSQRGSNDLPCYIITLNKEVIYHFPKDVKNEKVQEGIAKGNTVEEIYPYMYDSLTISNAIRDFINTPKENLLTKEYIQNFGVIDCLIAMDKRLGREKLLVWSDKFPKDHFVLKILKSRFNL